MTLDNLTKVVMSSQVAPFHLMLTKYDLISSYCVKKSGICTPFITFTNPENPVRVQLGLS